MKTEGQNRGQIEVLEAEIAAKDKIIKKLSSDLALANAGIGGTYCVIETDANGKEYATQIIQVATDGTVVVIAGEKGGIKLKRVRHVDEAAGGIELLVPN